MIDDENTDLISRVIAFYTKNPQTSFLLLVDTFPMEDPSELRMITEEIKSGKIQINNNELKKSIERTKKFNSKHKFISEWKESHKKLIVFLPWIMLICGFILLSFTIDAPYYDIFNPSGFYEWFLIVVSIVGFGLTFIGSLWILVLIQKKGIRIRFPWELGSL